MSQPGMRITVDAAMRARDVSRMPPDGKASGPPATPAEPAKPRKGERRRLGKRAANTQKTESRGQRREGDPPAGG